MTACFPAGHEESSAVLVLHNSDKTECRSVWPVASPATYNRCKALDMPTAYLVAHIDTTRMPPVLQSVGIYSESHNTLTNAFSSRSISAGITEVSGRTYEEARNNLLQYLRSFQDMFGWLTPHLTHGGGVRFEEGIAHFEGQAEGRPALDRILQDEEIT